VDTTTLVEHDIEAGRELIDALDRASFPVKAALWLYFGGAEDWRLVIASPVVERDGLKAAYTTVQSVRNNTPEAASIGLDSILLVRPDNQIVKVLSSFISGSERINPRIRRNTFDALYIEDAYVYRLAGDDPGVAAKRERISGIVADCVSRVPGASLEMGTWHTLNRSGNYQLTFKLNGGQRILEVTDEFMSDADAAVPVQQIEQALGAFAAGQARRAVIDHSGLRLSGGPELGTHGTRPGKRVA
jgi:hypothetical protein